MSTPQTAPAPKAAPTGGAVPPAQRLLDTAAELFASQGIRAVGIDQILREAGVAKASLYSTYGSKDALVITYLTDLDHADRNRWEQAVAGVHDPVRRILTFFDLAVGSATRRDYRGCLYANAATEYPGVELEPVRAHRKWLRATLTSLLKQAGVDSPTALARNIQLLYDGALLGSKLERSTKPITAARTLTEELIALRQR
ncbi:TetR/AcrR family transcriptional regulator [Mycolicibacterium fortuitum]|uniref:TetR family transcriptional regulator n=1 Tax=Mycolicibacterium fortuitum TaxID=1766 RepID=A0ABD6QSF5_MYCFO|nr:MULTISPECIES: TetR/AcrR family transcriptional regulator [Mycolicibacterium]OBB03538.1 TetR family transcriptional regulator [Mycolicibacterium fortuitum]OBI66057.1 TetR family transcriptional regulator [Mycolicibacterium fortuitum]OBK06845.1 TetR family transcriptional regulator [Mycolicibacterium fortuitum]OMC51258.1 TetR family transcriptional regulator [Mycolicibacterium fortuitum]UBV16635.1 TetR/AcrR family transcriptional regulator [Mycolicibacterium fortuitum]